jgi:hypothetical protein
MAMPRIAKTTEISLFIVGRCTPRATMYSSTQIGAVYWSVIAVATFVFWIAR